MKSEPTVEEIHATATWPPDAVTVGSCSLELAVDWEMMPSSRPLGPASASSAASTTTSLPASAWGGGAAESSAPASSPLGGGSAGAELELHPKSRKAGKAMRTKGKAGDAKR